jgi:hypothetical protein
VPFQFDFNSEHHILRARFEGRVLESELREYYRQGRSVVAQTDPRAAITDFSDASSLDVSAQAIRSMAYAEPVLAAPIVRFIVAPTPHMFGLARMFQIQGEQTRPNLHVFSTLQEVYDFLGVRDVHFDSVVPHSV